MHEFSDIDIARSALLPQRNRLSPDANVINSLDLIITEPPTKRLAIRLSLLKVPHAHDRRDLMHWIVMDGNGSNARVPLFRNLSHDS